ncbi:MAG TPA: ABC transporter permease [Fimbriimonas sp.]
MRGGAVNFWRLSRQLGLLMVVLAMFLAFAATSEPFRDSVNLLDRMRLWTEIGLIAIPMTWIIATGGIDLSVGSLVALSSMVAGVAYSQLRLPFPIALAAGVLAGVAGGAANGVAASVGKVPPLVATLATLAIYRGIAMGLGQGQPISGFPPPFGEWGNLAFVGSGPYAIPQQLLILLAMVLLGEVLLQKSRCGRWTLLLGENEVAARFAGIPVASLRFGLFVMSGLVSGLAAVTYMARSATAHPAANAGLELQAIACVVIGGTRITGGSGSVLGTFLGLLFLACLDFGLEMNGVLQQTQTILVGVLVVVIAVFNEWFARMSERRTPAAPLSSRTEGAG